MTITTRTGNLTLQVPDLERIPMPKTRAAVELALELNEKLRNALAKRQELDDRLIVAENAERVRMGEAYAAGEYEDPDNMGDEVAELRTKLAKVQTRIDGLEAGKVPAANAVRDAVAEESGAWAKIARQDAAKALTKLTTAVRMAEDAKLQLDATVGILGTLRAFNAEREAGGIGQLVHHIKAYGYVFSVAPGIEALREGIGQAAAELKELA